MWAGALKSSSGKEIKTETTMSRDEEIRLIASNKVWKRILKASAIGAALIFALSFIPQFLLLLLHIDRPEFGKALANLALAGAFMFIFGFIALVILCYILVVIAKIWRRYHPRVSVNDNQGPPTEAIPPALGQDSGPIGVSKVPSARRYFYLLTGGISGFIYILYYVGRAYCEGFYLSVGVPKSFINFELHDYIFFGAQVDTILITGAFTAVLVGLLMTRFFPRTEQSKLVDSFINRSSVVLALGYLVLYDLALVLFAYFQIYRPDLVVEPPFVISILMTCMVTLGILIVILYFDKDGLSRIRNGKIKRSIFITAAIVTLLFSPYMSGEAWGAYKGQIVKLTGFPQVELYANRELTDGIKWVPIDNVTYKSDQELYLIVKTTEYVILKTSDNSSAVYVLNPSDILSTKILSLGKNK